MNRDMSAAPGRRHKPHKLVLCFDGTGNKFHGNDSDSNILKIYRMLDRTADDQYHYYQRKHLHLDRHALPDITKPGLTKSIRCTQRA